MQLHPAAAPDAMEGAVVTKAVLRAADRLGVSQRVLARVLGVSEPSISRMNRGGFVLERGQKAFELAVLFIRLFRSLDAISGGEETVARGWLNADNTMLGQKPLDAIQAVQGLVNVIAYVDARRALV